MLCCLFARDRERLQVNFVPMIEDQVHHIQSPNKETPDNSLSTCFDCSYAPTLIKGVSSNLQNRRTEVPSTGILGHWSFWQYALAFSISEGG